MNDKEEKQTVIIGAGITGLRLAQQLSQHKKITVIEKRKHLGGLATSFKYKDFTFDIGPHKIYSIIPGIMQQFKDIMQDDCITVNKKNSIRLQGYSYTFPIKPLQFAMHFNPLTAMRCGASFATTFANKPAKEYIISYEDYFINGFGKAAYELLFKDIAQKVWGNPTTLSAELAERRIPIPSILKIAQQLFTKKLAPEVSASQFYYPKNGLGTIIEKMSRQTRQNRGHIYAETTPETIELKNSRIISMTFRDRKEEKRITPENVISTIHIIDLIKLIKPTPPPEVIEAAKKLKYRSLIIVYLIINKPKAMEDQWIFFPEKEYIFSRVAEQKNFSCHTAPTDKTALTAEVGCKFQDDTYNLPDKELYSQVIKDLEKAGITKREDVEEYFTIKINRCYPVYEIGYKENLAKILAYIDSIENLYTIGRQGLFNYNNTDHSIDMANKLAQHVLSNKTKKEWQETRQEFENYRIVD